MTKDQLIEKVIKQIQQDFHRRELAELSMLLQKISNEDLVAFLPNSTLINKN